MRFLALFIYRPVATLLVAAAILLAGILGFRLLPVAALPQVDFPAIVISASMPGASAETMAASIATPLERSLGRIAGISEMTSISSLSNTRVILIFDLDRDINGAARDVQAALNAAQSLLPTGMPSRPTYRKANPSDAPVMILTLTSDTYSRGQLYDYATTRLAQSISQIEGSVTSLSAEDLCLRSGWMWIHSSCLTRVFPLNRFAPPSVMPIRGGRRVPLMTEINAGSWPPMMPWMMQPTTGH